MNVSGIAHTNSAVESFFEQLIPHYFRENDAESLAYHLSVADDGRVAIRERVAPAGLDEVSRAIIEQLQQDGRRSYASIAAAVGLSEAAVRQRVQRLTDSGLMQIVAVTDPLQVGFARSAMIGVKIDGDIEIVADKMASMSEVDYLVITAGSYDVLAEVVCEDDEHLLEVINQRIRAIPGVRATETFVYLKLQKQIYTWGTR